MTGEGGLRAALAKVLDYFEEACEYIAENPSEDDRLTAYMRRIDEARAALAAPAPDTLREALKIADEAIFDLPIGEDVTYSRGYSAGIAAARAGFRDALTERLRGLDTEAGEQR